jgi:hypothetical protein
MTSSGSATSTLSYGATPSNSPTGTNQPSPSPSRTPSVTLGAAASASPSNVPVLPPLTPSASAAPGTYGVPAALSFGNVEPEVFANETTLGLLASSIADAVTAMLQQQESVGVVEAPTYVAITEVQDMTSQVIMFRGAGVGSETATASPSASVGAVGGGGRRRRMQAGGAAFNAVQISYVVLLPPGWSTANRTNFLKALLTPFAPGSPAPPGFELFTSTIVQNVLSGAAAAGLLSIVGDFAGVVVTVAKPAYGEC